MPPNLRHGPELLSIPGPSMMPERVLSAMGRQMIDIYEGDLVETSDRVRAGLARVARTTVLPFVAVANGHGAWEMALTNTLSRGDRVLVVCCGRFAAGWGQFAGRLGVEVETMRADPGRAFDPDQLYRRLAADPRHTLAAVLCVQVDTATSARNDIAAFRAAIDRAGHPALLMVDGIASLGCERFELDAWAVDVLVGGSQKGLMTPPGLGFVWAGPRAMQAHARAGLRTGYWDWTARLDPKAHYLRYAGTPPVSHLLALDEALAMIEEEGLEARYRRHRVLADAVRAAVEAWQAPAGLHLAVEAPDERANSVTTLHTGSVDAEALRALCQQGAGVTLGLGIATEASAGFRIGHMGFVNAPMVLGTLGTIEAALHALGAPLGGSGVAAAATVLGAELAELEVARRRG